VNGKKKDTLAGRGSSAVPALCRNRQKAIEPVHLAYNPSFSAGFFFSRNSIFFSQQISQ
jgi:hypothetical protein